MKKKIYISILTTMLCFPMFMWTPLANTVSQSYTTGYGSYYFTYNNDLDTFLLHLGNLGGVNMKGYCQSLIYEFNDSYSGYLDIHLLSESIWNNATIITENCYVKGKNSSQWDYSIGFNDVTSIKVTVVLPTLTTNNAWSGNKMALTTNYNIPRDLTDIPDMLEDIQTSLGTVDAQTPDMLHSLSNIYGVESASRQLLSEIEYAIRGNNSLYVLADDMGTIITDLNAVITNVATLHTDLQTINNSLNSIIKIPWQTNNFVLRGYGTNINSYQNIYPNVSYYQLGANDYLIIRVLSAQEEYLSIINLDIPISNSTNFKLYTRNSAGNLYEVPESYYLYKQVTNFRINLYIQMPAYQGEYHFFLKPNSSGTVFYYPTQYSNYGSIKSYTQVYWDLLAFFKQDRYNLDYSNKLQGIIDAVNNMSLNVNQLTVNATGITYNVNNTQVNNSVNNYNTNINQVYNIENNISADFDTYNQQFTPDFSTSLTALQDTSTMMNGIISQINGIQLFTVPILLTLAGIVLLAILG